MEELDMMVRRYGPQPLGRLRDEMDRMLWGLYRAADGGGGAQPDVQVNPLINVWEAEDRIFVEAELPGVKQDDLDISVVNDELSIKGQRKEEVEAESVYHRRERSTGTFMRVLQLPVEVDADRVTATLTDGVLLVELPKSEAARPRKIEVKAT
jgi:HSP20 family protein